MTKGYTIPLIVILSLLTIIGLVVAVNAVLIIYRQHQARNAVQTRQYGRRRQERVELEELWRRQRLRQVVVLLLRAGVVVEGIPVAFQLTARAREIHVRRRSRRAMTPLSQQWQVEQDMALDPRVREVLHTPLTKLLATGRPPAATAGPDILQLLLIQHEDHFAEHIEELARSQEEAEEDELLRRDSSVAAFLAQLSSANSASEIVRAERQNHSSHLRLSSFPDSRSARIQPNVSPPPLTSPVIPDLLPHEAKQVQDVLEAHRIRRMTSGTAEDMYGSPAPYIPSLEAQRVYREQWLECLDVRQHRLQREVDVELRSPVSSPYVRMIYSLVFPKGAVSSASEDEPLGDGCSTMAASPWSPEPPQLFIEVQLPQQPHEIIADQS